MQGTTIKPLHGIFRTCLNTLTLRANIEAAAQNLPADVRTTIPQLTQHPPKQSPL